MARRMRAWAAVCMQRELHCVRQSIGKTAYIVASKGSGAAKESPPSYVCLDNGGSRGRGDEAGETRGAISNWTEAARMDHRLSPECKQHGVVQRALHRPQRRECAFVFSHMQKCYRRRAC